MQKNLLDRILGGRFAENLIRRIGDYAVVRYKGGLRVVHDPNGAALGFPGGISFHSHLEGIHMRNGKVFEHRDLGSGMVTNVGVLAMANDFAWSAQLNLATLALANQHAWGTGAVAAATTDIVLGALAAPTTVAAVAGTQTLISAANVQQYKSSGTITAGGGLAITEWGLHTSGTLTASTGSPFTATSATTWQDTGSVLTASSATVRGQQQTIVYNATTDVWGLNLSNTIHIGTIPAWYKKTDGTAGATPGNTAYTLLPVLWDRKVFAAYNVVATDQIIFNYTLTITAGG